jgi:hypothetical protein
VRGATGEVVAPRVEADLGEALRAASRGDDVGSAMPHSGLQSWQLRYDTAFFGAEANDDTVEIRTRSARPRRSTGVSVDALVRREGAASTASRRGAHRRPSPLPRRMRLLVAAVGTAVAAAGTSMVALMPDHGASARTVTGQDHAEARRLGVPSAGPSVSADVPDLHPAISEELAASSRLGTAASGEPRPSLVPKRTEQTGPAQTLHPTPSPRTTPDAESTEDAGPTEDAEPTEETDGRSSRRSKGAESRGSGDRDRGSDGRSGGAGRRG